MLDTALPVATYGDGNCLFRAVSLSLFGYDDAHLALRVMAAIEIGEHREFYDKDSQMCHCLLRNPVIVCPSYTDVFQEVTKVGADSCVVAI